MAWVLLLQPRTGKINQLLRATPFFGGESGPFDVYSVPFIVLFTGIHFVPFVTLFLSSALQAMDERLDHAARIAGAGWLRTQARIVVPLIRPAIVYAVALIAIFGLGQFTTPLILGRPKGVDVLTTEMWRAVNYAPVSHEVAALLGSPLIIAGFLLIVVQRMAIGATSRYQTGGHGLEGGAAERRWPVIPIVLFGAFMVIPPVLTLMWTSLLPYWNPDLGFESVSFDNYRSIFQDQTTSDAIYNSIRFAVAGTLLGVVTCTFIAVIGVRHGRTVLGRIVDYLVNLPITIPGIVFGLGVFLALATGPLSLTGSPILYVVIYVLATLPHGTRLIMAGLTQIGESSEVASRVHGASAVRSLASILLPLLRRSLGAAMIVMFVLMIQEFGAATMVQTPTTDVMATRMFAMWEEGFLQTEAAAMAVVMCGICALGTGILLLFSSGGSRGRRGVAAAPTAHLD
jgi:iron(III) transport system permease protein